MENMTHVELFDGERQELKYALENRIEYLVYGVHMHPMADDIQTSIRLLDILGYRKSAQGYREMMSEWERMYNEHDYPDYDD